MSIHTLFKRGWQVLVPLALALAVGVACGEDAPSVPTPTPQPTIDAGAISAQVQAGLKETVREAVAGAVPEAVTAKEIGVLVEAAVAGAVPEAVTAAEIGVLVQAAVEGSVPEGVSPGEIRSLVEAAVTAAIPEGATAEEIRAMVQSAVEAATQGGVTREEMANLVKEAVTEAAAGGPVPVSAEDVRKIVASAIEAIPTPAPPPAVVKPVYGGIIPFSAQVGKPSTWDPHEGVVVEDLQAFGPMYNQLIQYNPIVPGEIISDLAESWKLGNDGLTYTFTLRKGVEWSDGQPVTAEDVVFSLKRMVEPGQPRPSTSKIAGYVDVAGEWVERIDDETVRVHLEFPSRAFLAFLAVDFFKILPKHIIDAGVDLTPFGNKVGTGPFLPVSYDEGVVYEFTRNPNYYERGRPFYDGYKGILISEKGREIAAFKTDQVVMNISVVNQLGIDDVMRLEEDPSFSSRYDIYPMKGATIFHLDLNVKKAPFDDPNLRRALFLGLDRQHVTGAMGFGRWGVGGAMEPQSPFALPEEELMALPGYRQLDGKNHPDDLAEARRLLAEAGFTDANPFKFTFLVWQILTFPDTALIVSQQLERDLPVEIDFRLVEITAGITAAVEGNFEMQTGGVAPMIIDPDDRFQGAYMDVGRNFSGWHDPVVDDLFDKQQKEIDPLKRLQLAYDMQRAVLNGAPGHLEYSWVPLNQIVSKRVRTEGGGFIQSFSAYTALKHAHEWLDPE